MAEELTALQRGEEGYMSKLHDELVSMSACSEAVKWVGNRSLATAWAKCERADWMLWYAHKRGVDARIMTRAACACARTALQYVPAGEDRPRLAIEAAEAWADDPTPAWAAAGAAAWAAAGAAAGAAAWAAARAAAWAAARAAAGAAARAAAGAAAWDAAHKKMCNLVRGIITVKMLNK